MTIINHYLICIKQHISPSAAALAVAIMSLLLATNSAIAGGPSKSDNTPIAAQSWTVPQRTLPFPPDVSDDITEWLNNAPKPDIAARIKNTSHTTTEEWMKFISTRDKGGLERANALIDRFNVNVEQDSIAGVNVYRVTPTNIHPDNKNRLFVHIHGGAYVAYGGRAALFEATLIAHRANIQVLSIDYRMPPEHPFPTAVDDVVNVWKSLIKDWNPKRLAFGGTSAGGGLALASTHKFKDLGLAVPGALFTGTPWSDLTKTGDSYFINEGVDSAHATYDGFLIGAAKLYANGHDMKDPLLSPVYGNFEGFPPTYLVSGTRDLFLSNTVRVFRKLRTAGVVADLNIFEGLSHAHYTKVVDSPESIQTFAELGAFLLQHLEQ